MYCFFQAMSRTVAVQAYKQGNTSYGMRPSWRRRRWLRSTAASVRRRAPSFSHEQMRFGLRRSDGRLVPQVTMPFDCLFSRLVGFVRNLRNFLFSPTFLMLMCFAPLARVCFVPFSQRVACTVCGLLCASSD